MWNTFNLGFYHTETQERNEIINGILEWHWVSLNRVLVQKQSKVKKKKFYFESSLKVESFASAKAKVKLNHSDITAVCMSQRHVIFISCEASS